MQPWQGPAGAGAPPNAPPPSQPLLSPLSASRSLLDTPQSMKPLPSPEQAQLLEFRPLAAALPAGLPLAQPPQGDGEAAPSAGPSLFLAALQRHMAASKSGTPADAAQPLAATRPQWRPLAEARPGLPPAAPAAPAAQAELQPVLAPLQPLLHILGALQQSPQQLSLQHAPPLPAAQPAAQQPQEQAEQQGQAEAPAPALATQNPAATPLQPARTAAPSTGPPAVDMLSVLAALQPLLRANPGQAGPQHGLPTPAQPQPPPAPLRRPPNKSRSGSRSGARTSAGGAQRKGSGGRSSTQGAAAGAGRKDRGRPERSGGRRRARGSSPATPAGDASGLGFHPLLGGATITTGHASPERRGSGPGGGAGLLGSPRGLSLARTAFATSPNPSGGPVRIVAAESPAPAVAAAAAGDQRLADDWVDSRGCGAPAPGAGGWVPPLFVAGQGRRPFCYVLGGVLRFESPGLAAIRITDPSPAEPGSPPASSQGQQPPAKQPAAERKRPRKAAEGEEEEREGKEGGGGGGASGSRPPQWRQQQAPAAKRRRRARREEDQRDAQAEAEGQHKAAEQGRKEEDEDEPISEAGSEEEGAEAGQAGSGVAPPAAAAAAAAGSKGRKARGEGEGREPQQSEVAPFAVAPPTTAGAKPFSMRSLKYKGVYRMPTGRWRTQFTFRNKVIQIGMFDTEEEAARAWDRAAVQYRGAGTKINIPVPQATIQAWLKEKPVGWCLFFDDDDQPLPQPLAGAALQQKQRELAEKGQKRGGAAAGCGGGAGETMDGGKEGRPPGKAGAAGAGSGGGAKQECRPAGRAGAAGTSGRAEPGGRPQPSKRATPAAAQKKDAASNGAAAGGKAAPAAAEAEGRSASSRAGEKGGCAAAAAGTKQGPATPAAMAAARRSKPAPVEPAKPKQAAAPSKAPVQAAPDRQAAVVLGGKPEAAPASAEQAQQEAASAPPAIEVPAAPTEAHLASPADAGAAAAVTAADKPAAEARHLQSLLAPVLTPITTGAPPAAGPAAAPPLALPPPLRAVRMLPLPATAQPPPLGLPGPAVSIVTAKALPLLVMAQRFMPGQQLLPAITTGARPLAPPAVAPKSPRQGQKRGGQQQTGAGADAPAGDAPPMPPRTWLRQRATLRKRLRGEEEAAPAAAAEVQPSPGLPSPALQQRPQRPRRASAQAARGSADSATGAGPRSGSPGGGAASRRSLADSLFAAVAVVEKEEEAAAAAAAAGAGTAGALPSLPPLSIPPPAGRQAAEQQLTPTAAAVTTPLSPGRPAHRQRKGHAQSAPDAAAPPAWEPLPGSLLLALAGASGSEGGNAEEDAGGTWKEHDRGQRRRQATPAATLSPLRMVLRGKRQRTSE